MKTARTIPTKLALLVGIAIVASTLFIGSSMASVSSNRVVLGAYSCCGDATCDTLLATHACPSGDAQCTGIKINDVQTKCCVSRCNDPHPVDPEPVDPVEPP